MCMKIAARIIKKYLNILLKKTRLCDDLCDTLDLLRKKLKFIYLYLILIVLLYILICSLKIYINILNILFFNTVQKMPSIKKMFRKRYFQ